MTNKELFRVSLKTALDELAQIAGGQRFRVEFIKRSDGSRRVMDCALKVRKGVKGVGRSFDVRDHDLISVWSFDADGFRLIPIEGLQALHANGEILIVDDSIEDGVRIPA